MPAKHVVAEALALPVGERLELAEQLWRSVRDDAEAFAPTDAQRRLLDDRLRDAADNPADESPVDVAIAGLRANA